MYCCDLAGSEKIDKTITSSMTAAEARKVMKEGQNINTSLLALGAATPVTAVTSLLALGIAIPGYTWSRAVTCCLVR